jgi:preprotein translocase subunit SecF
MTGIEVPDVDYTAYSNRQLVLVPLAVLALAIVVIGGWYVVTGAPATPGLEFTGGVELRVVDDGEDVRGQIETAFDRQPDAIQSIPADDVYVVTFRAAEGDPEDLAGRLDDQAAAANLETTGIDQVSPNFAADTVRTAIFGLALAFLGMSVLVFALFRTVVPSVAVVASAFSDLVIPVAAMNLLGIEMTLGIVAALLMIIGYSVDSDILLNNSVLRRTGGFYESVSRAMRTGVTMTITWLCADLMNTYLLNVALLRWYTFEGVSR